VNVILASASLYVQYGKTRTFQISNLFDLIDSFHLGHSGSSGFSGFSGHLGHPGYNRNRQNKILGFLEEPEVPRVKYCLTTQHNSRSSGYISWLYQNLTLELQEILPGSSELSP
jgi:hypothetical protein